MPTCEETFPNSTECWWRNKYYPCCTIFSKHKSEYGICYTFNSKLNDMGKIQSATQRDYPRRAFKSGDWSALRFYVNTTSANRTPASKIYPGYTVIAHNPDVWPNMGYIVPAGSFTQIIIKTMFTYTTAGVAFLSPNDRQCIYDHEISKSGGTTLPGLLYIQLNCISECRQRFMIDKCGCTLEYLFPIGDYKPCNINGLICLNQYSSKQNNLL